MLKPLTLSLSLVVALGASSVSMAGLFDGHHSGALASPQGVIASPQEILPSAQCDTGGCWRCLRDRAKKNCNLFGFLHRPKSYSYTWVLKKKRIRGHKGADCGGCDGGCDSCDTGAVYPSGQYASPQAYGSGQSYGSSQTYGSGQAYSARAYGSGQAYGGQRPGLRRQRPGLRCDGLAAGHLDAGPARRPAPAPAPAGDEAPPAPEVPAAPARPGPAAPAAPEAPAPNAPQSSLLFSTPSGN